MPRQAEEEREEDTTVTDAAAAWAGTGLKRQRAIIMRAAEGRRTAVVRLLPRLGFPWPLGQDQDRDRVWLCATGILEGPIFLWDV